MVKLTIKNKIFMSFILIIAVLLIFISINLSSLNEINSLSSKSGLIESKMIKAHERIILLDTLENEISLISIGEKNNISEKIDNAWLSNNEVELTKILEKVKLLEDNVQTLIREDSRYDYKNLEKILNKLRELEDIFQLILMDSTESVNKFDEAYDRLREIKKVEEGLINDYAKDLQDNLIQRKEVINLSIYRLLIMGVFIFLFGLLPFSLFKKIITHLYTLREYTNEIAKGNLDTKIKLEAKDEFADLFNSFESMREALKVSRKELEKYSKTLEKKVVERTKELQKKNEELERFNKLAMGRELKMIELKKKIKELESKLKGK